MHVLSGAGRAGWPASAVLALLLLGCGAAYIAALRRPPGPRLTVLAAAVALAVALASPVLFSADVFAYAYYGDLVLHGADPYAHDAAAPRDALTAAVRAAWDGRLPPACVYGPAAIALAVLADVAGSAFGAAGQVAAQRALAVLAFGACIAVWFRLVRGGAARAAFALNPVLIWSVAEGHNDAAMLAAVLAALAAGARARPWLVAVGVLVKAPAVVAFAALRSSRTTTLAAGAVLVGYLPLAAGLLRGSGWSQPHVAWQSPLGAVALLVGRPAAVLAAAVVCGAAAVAVRRLPQSDRAGAFALVAWYLLPNAYPWYALWIVPVAAANLRSAWAPALIAAAFSAPLRAVTDAIFPADGALHVEMMALQYLPPVLVRAAHALRKPALAAAAIAAGVLACGHLPAGAQPTPAPAPQPSVTPYVPPPPPTPSVTAAPSPSPSASPSPAPSASPQSPYAYVVTPPPATAAPGDGPQILDIAMNDRTLRPGGPLLVRVHTSPNVVGVEARALGRFLSIPQNAPGTFVLAGSMPGGIPFFLVGRNYDVVFAAATADGRQATLTVPITLGR
ncbi:MAG: hypothetical protein ABR591_04505 [Candidatus Velthaea sp.]